MVYKKGIRCHCSLFSRQSRFCVSTGAEWGSGSHDVPHHHAHQRGPGEVQSPTHHHPHWQRLWQHWHQGGWRAGYDPSLLKRDQTAVRSSNALCSGDCMSHITMECLLFSPFFPVWIFTYSLNLRVTRRLIIPLWALVQDISAGWWLKQPVTKLPFPCQCEIPCLTATHSPRALCLSAAQDSKAIMPGKGGADVTDASGEKKRPLIEQARAIFCCPETAALFLWDTEWDDDIRGEQGQAEVLECL